jgi:hypothetical protein
MAGYNAVAQGRFGLLLHLHSQRTHTQLMGVEFERLLWHVFSLLMAIHKRLACSSSTTESKRILETALSAAASHV